VGGPETLALSAGEAGLLAFLVVPATVVGFAVWNALLRRLPASTVGLTVFLNPPLTTASKACLSAVFPASFAFVVTGQEWLGGATALAGVAVAVAPWRALRGRPARREPS
jgi:drug/metabolite transporter (DMT)-like permease